MTNWPIKTLGEVAIVGAGNSAPQDKKLFEAGTHRFVRTSDVGRIRIGRLGDSSDLLNDAGVVGLRKFRAGVTLIPKSGASTFLNHRVLLIKSCYVSSHLAVVDPNPEVMDDRFIFYFLQTIKSQDLIQDQSYPSLNLPAIAGINVLVPPLEEQKRIVVLLDQATARITELTACYEQACTHANNLFTSALRDELEGNPDWPVKSLGEVCELSLGKMLDSKQKNGLNPTPYLRNVNVRWGSIDTSDLASMDIRPEEMGRVTALPGDVVVCEGGEPGRCAVWRGPGRVAIQKALHRVRPKMGIEADYVARYLAYLAENGELKFFFTGTTIKHIPKEKLKLVPILVPPLEVQKRIVARLDAMRTKTSEMVTTYEAKLQSAKDLRQSILDAAFAGEL